MARDGMTTLIGLVRERANAGTADFTRGTVTYFTDDHIEDTLDFYRTLHKRVQLIDQPDYVDSDNVYLEYCIPELQYFEEEAYDSGWAVRDGSGGTAPAYTVDYRSGVITFDSDTQGTAYYLDCRTYNLDAVVSDVFEIKAGNAANQVDWKSDNHDIKASQRRANLMKQANDARMQGGVKLVLQRRIDER